MTLRPLILMSALLAACGKQTAPETPPAAVEPRAEPAAEIAWYEGSVEDAFATARDQNKPVFMYWGAVWCPPCNQLKSTVFNRPDFIEHTRGFVPVYVDGDSPGAQKLGERFGAMGYPTLIVFRPDGTELTRITSGMELERYPQVLALAAKQTQPVAELVDRVLAEPDSAGDDDLRLLAFYGWPADLNRVLGERDPTEVFAQFGRAAGDQRPLLHNRFMLLSLIAYLDGKDADAELSGVAAGEGSRRLLRNILSDPEQLRANLTELQYDGPRLVLAVTKPGSEARAELAEGLVYAMDDVFDDEALPVKQRLLTTHTLITLHRILNPDAPVPDELVALVERRATWANEAATTPYERQSLIYNAANYLHDVGRSEAARELFIAEIDRAVSPHYYMGYVASIEQDLGNHEAAISWARKAWEAAEGPATRAQWGIGYARTLIEVAPQDAQTIEATVSRIIDELRRNPGSFYQRTRVRMQRLDAALQEWAEVQDQAEVVKRIQAGMQSLCEQLPADAEARGVCDRFLTASR